ncbi:MAG TPA: hypothetical protein VGY53_00090 [Isosphaeraceae bacterium]|nr:hypothetical protein [Isosphaeraceae bacterium]
MSADSPRASTADPFGAELLEPVFCGGPEPDALFGAGVAEPERAGGAPEPDFGGGVPEPDAVVAGADPEPDFAPGGFESVLEPGAPATGLFDPEFA